MEDKLRIGIVQKGAYHSDLNRSLELAAEMAAEAAQGGAGLVVFGESWLSGYPAWIDHCPDVALWGSEGTKKAYAGMFRNSLVINSQEFKRLSEIASDNGIVLVIGANEVVNEGPGNGTIYNSLLTFGKDGTLLNHHRKLVPTFNEKLLYGHGDGAGLKAVDTDFGRIGTLVCWEHWMPHSRQALHNSREDIHIAVWPEVNEKHQLASRHYAFEGRCFVVAAGQIMRASDIPESLTLPDHLKARQEEMLLRGGSCVIGPDGDYLLEPSFDYEGVLYCDIDNFDKLIEEKLTLDVSGHYNRPDIFEFNVNRRRES